MNGRSGSIPELVWASLLIISAGLGPFAGCLAIILFSMAGIPPLAGFVGKLLILNIVVDSNLFFLATIAVLTSVIAAFYYIRMVKSIFFDEPTEELDILTNNQSKLLMIIFFVI